MFQGACRTKNVIGRALPATILSSWLVPILSISHRLNYAAGSQAWKPATRFAEWSSADWAGAALRRWLGALTMQGLRCCSELFC